MLTVRPTAPVLMLMSPAITVKQKKNYCEPGPGSYHLIFDFFPTLASRPKINKTLLT